MRRATPSSSVRGPVLRRRRRRRRVKLCSSVVSADDAGLECRILLAMLDTDSASSSPLSIAVLSLLRCQLLIAHNERSVFSPTRLAHRVNGMCPSICGCVLGVER
uniref:Uncharacterized protein n=1 Tax=Plectus sambesii TaxID=2011161 RepID=A0A914V0H7_9BILA